VDPNSCQSGSAAIAALPVVPRKAEYAGCRVKDIPTQSQNVATYPNQVRDSVLLEK